MTLRWRNAGVVVSCRWLAASVVTLLCVHTEVASAAVSYDTIGSMYTQDFNGLPTNTETNSNIETGATAPEINYPTGWTDDNASPPAGALSIEGWYLYHPVTQTEGGANDHQRFRFGAGSNTGSFYGFANGNATNSEKALGSSSSTTMAAQDDFMHMAVRLTNNTGQTLNRFTLTYDGEQWRDGDGGAETLLFGYSTSATPADWFVVGNTTLTPALDFVAPVTTTPGANVDGNVAGRVNDITATITGFAWAPGADLWLRWSDKSIAGNDDNLAIDDIELSADAGGVGPTVIVSVQSGLASDASTWSNSQPASAGNAYHVVDNDVVTVNAAFPGSELRATNTGTVNFSASGVHVPLLAVDAGGSITETVSGDFSLGDAFAPVRGTMIVNQDLSFNMDAGADFFLSFNVFGTGDLDFNSNGANSDLWLVDAGHHSGTIRFNGTGDKVILPLAEAFNILEMNSTGANTLDLNGSGNTSVVGKAIFNQPGTVLHSSNLNRLQGPSHLVANADVTIDLTTTYGGTTPNERRASINEKLEGTGDITVNGTSFDPTGGQVTLNEFEVGGTGQPGVVQEDDHSGTITANDYVNVEIRHNLRSAGFVVNNNARLETGHQRIPVQRQMFLGEIQVNLGGTLEVGFEQDGAHNAGVLNLVSTDGRSGGLTLADGSKLLMQVNGTTTQLFDSITAQGDVSLNGTLEILVNPTGSPDPDQPMGTAYDPYTPVVGHTFDIITLTGAAAPGDYNGGGTVGPEDYDVWKQNFGTTDAAADGNGDGVVDVADFIVWNKNQGATGSVGDITGTFDTLTHNLPAGFGFVVHYLATKVQLEIVAAGAGSAVPEPSALVLAGLMMPLASVCRRRRS